MAKWTDEEIRILKETYPTQGSSACAALLGKSISSITSKAHKLGVRSVQYRPTHEEYEQKLFEKELDAFPVEKYVNNKTAILHECLEGHQWRAQPTNILDGHGCPKCAKYGFDETKPAWLYYVKIGDYYKVGITNRSTIDRFELDWKHQEITILDERLYALGGDARNAERAILAKYPRVNLPGQLKSGGNSELFEYDVLEGKLP
jgi:hypothetical protein